MSHRKGKNKKIKTMDGIQMPRGKCLVASSDDREFKSQLDRLCFDDRKIVADFRRLLRNKAQRTKKAKS